MVLAVSPAGPVPRASGRPAPTSHVRAPKLRPTRPAPPCPQKFDSSFNFLLKFGLRGDGDGQVRGTLGSAWQNIRAQSRSAKPLYGRPPEYILQLPPCARFSNCSPQARPWHTERRLPHS